MNKQELFEYKQKVMFKDGVKLGPSMILSKNLERPMYANHIGNENILVIGDTVSGKTRSVVIPNLLQMTGSYIVNDPTGEIYDQVGEVMKEYGYKVGIFDPAAKGKDYSYNPIYYFYNPLSYICDEHEVNMFVDCFIRSTNKDGIDYDEFLFKAEQLLYCACIHYLLDHCTDASKINLASVKNMINSFVLSDDVSNSNPSLDELFDKLPNNSLASKYYKAFKQAAGKSVTAIIMNSVIRLRPFFDPEIDKSTKIDCLELEKLDKEKRVIFIRNHFDRETSFLTSLLITQAYNVLTKSNEKGKYPVTFVLDEFVQIGKIPEIEMKMSVGRKYKISFIITAHNINQLNLLYKEKAELIIGNSSTLIYQGSMEPNTVEYFEKLFNKYKIFEKDSFLKENYQMLKQNNCVVLCVNMKPMIDKKYDLKKHPLYYKINNLTI